MNLPSCSTLAFAAGPMQVATSAPRSPQFYKYRTADGRIVIVDSLSQVPPAERARAEPVDVTKNAAPTSTTSASVIEASKHLDLPSFAAGFGVALVLGVVVSLLFRNSARAVSALLLVGFLVAGTGAYFGWLRRSTGQSEALLSSPTAVIDDARKAVEKMKQAQKQQEQTIHEIEKQAP